MVAPSQGMNMGYTYQPAAVATSTDSGAMVVAPNMQANIIQGQEYL